MTLESSKILRTVDNYSEHASKHSFGVIEKCIFNDIPEYDKQRINRPYARYT